MHGVAQVPTEVVQSIKPMLNKLDMGDMTR